MHRIAAIMVRHFYEMRHNANHFANAIYWPIVNIVIWGFLTIYLRHGNGLKPGVVNSLLGAVILWSLFNSFQRDMATGFLEELWSRNLLNLFASPLTITEYIMGLLTVNVFKAAAGMLVECVIAWLFYHFNIFPKLAGFVPFIFNLILFGLVVGIAITGVIFRYTTRFQTMAWSFAGLLMPLSCVFYPLNSLPDFLRIPAWLLPTTHCFEGMRELLAGGYFSVVQFKLGLALNCMYFVGSVLLFRRLFESARSRGLLVKME